MPFVRISIVKEVLAADPSGKKAAISRSVAAAIFEATGLPATEVSVVFDEVDARDWYVGDTSVETLRFKT